MDNETIRVAVDLVIFKEPRFDSEGSKSFPLLIKFDTGYVIGISMSEHFINQIREGQKARELQEKL